MGRNKADWVEIQVRECGQHGTASQTDCFLVVGLWQGAQPLQAAVSQRSRHSEGLWVHKEGAMCVMISTTFLKVILYGHIRRGS